MYNKKYDLWEETTESLFYDESDDPDFGDVPDIPIEVERFIDEIAGEAPHNYTDYDLWEDTEGPLYYEGPDDPDDLYNPDFWNEPSEPYMPSEEEFARVAYWAAVEDAALLGIDFCDYY